MPLLMTDKMKYLIILISLLTPVQAESYFYARVGLGDNNAVSTCECWDDGGSIGGRIMFGNRHHLGGKWFGDINFLHHSQPFIGHPFDDRNETSSYHLYYDVEYRF